MNEEFIQSYLTEYHTKLIQTLEEMKTRKTSYSEFVLGLGACTALTTVIQNLYLSPLAGKKLQETLDAAYEYASTMKDAPKT